MPLPHTICSRAPRARQQDESYSTDLLQNLLGSLLGDEYAPKLLSSLSFAMGDRTSMRSVLEDLQQSNVKVIVAIVFASGCKRA